MLRIERRNVEGPGSKEMAFDKPMIWLVAYIHIKLPWIANVPTKHSLLSKLNKRTKGHL